MKTFSILLVVLLLLSSAVLAQMQLKLATDFESQDLQTINKELHSNLKLDLAMVDSPPSDALNFYKGLIIAGLMADLTIPMGKEDGFKHLAGTGFSAHAMAGYFITSQFLLALRAGYIKFGTQTEEGPNYSYEDSYSQIPILIGAYYILAMQGSFKPYLGLSLGLMFQNYRAKWREQFGQGYPDYNLDESFSATSFAIVPGIGVYYILAALMIHLSVEYNLLFSGVPSAENNYNYNLGKGSGFNATTATDDETKASSLSINLGVSIPVGGN